MEDDSDENVRHKYLTACLLTFYQQAKLYRDKRDEFRSFLIERPLWIFVGGSVTKTPRKRDISDIVDILRFLASFVGGRERSEEIIAGLLAGHSDLLDRQGRELFHEAFPYLNTLGLSPQQIFDDILRLVFNASGPAALHVENLKGSEGEVALRLGENEPFGVINVGDPSALCRLCEEQGTFVVTDKVFSGSLFRSLNDEESTISVLIGSKKFTEGWSSWRVSTMGLMNIARNEGPQIIQLFGRGVRLKGKGFSLKRSRRLDGLDAPKYLELLETLNVFGIRADYMRQFKEDLEEESLPPNEDRMEFVLPVIKTLGQRKLKVVRLADNVDFTKDGPKVVVDGAVPDFLKRSPVVLDWYPKLQAITSAAGPTSAQPAERHREFFEDLHLAFLDFDALYFELARFKEERGWHNLSLSRENLPVLLAQKNWYQLYIPKEEMEFTSFRKTRRWQEIAETLLKKYLDRVYRLRKREFESGHLELRELSEDDPNFINEYRLLVEQSRQDIIQKLEEIGNLIATGALRNIEFQSLHTIAFERHLYVPLIYVGSDLVDIKPVVLENEGERDFVLDLQTFCESQTGKEFLKDRELYLLRNMSRGRGIGFFEAGNFYPDFILWVLCGDRQYVSFIDPKGLRNLEGPDDPKIRFHRTIKELERQLADPKVTLSSFIVSSTRVQDVAWWGSGMTKEDFEEINVFFQGEDREGYIAKLLAKVIANATQEPHAGAS
ncbi:MAG: hypothetical protein KatS3mg007_0777 [Thermoanaerobaculum sp.]|nr:MAG: hypothetical protein KatS3mg007_0777 [Thermoanaerobaculum sp.]